MFLNALNGKNDFNVEALLICVYACLFFGDREVDVIPWLWHLLFVFVIYLLDRYTANRATPMHCLLQRRGQTLDVETMSIRHPMVQFADSDVTLR